MILPIVAYGDPVLKVEGVEIDKDYEGLSELLDNMWETMYNARGVGLAAPQIGKSIRLFIVDASPFAEDDEEGEPDPKAEGLENFKKVFINPIIEEEERSEEHTSELQSRPHLVCRLLLEKKYFLGNL